MLVIISDLHLTDGTSGETIRPGAFRALRENLRELAYDASWRSDKKYVPVDGIDLVLLGDILDIITFYSLVCRSGTGSSVGRSERRSIFRNGYPHYRRRNSKQPAIVEHP
jgi:hypothetical protein